MTKEELQTRSDNSEKVKIIWNFILDWKDKTYKFYLENANLFIELKNNHKQAWEEYKKTQEYEEAYKSYSNYRSKWEIEYAVEQDFSKDYYSDILSLTTTIVTRNNIDTIKLQKILDQEAMTKYNTLLKQVTYITGTIIDAKDLRLGGKGDLNGIVIGEKGKAKVETFGADGYNIQVSHYRTKVTEVR